MELNRSASVKDADACTHPAVGPRAAPWCKILALAVAMQRGVRGRRCAAVMWLDSDAYVVDPTVSRPLLDCPGRAPRASTHRPPATAPRAHAPSPPQMSIEAYLTRARRLGDEAVAPGSGPWELLLSSNTPFQPDSVCTAVLWLHNTAGACGLLRRWWDAPWPEYSHRHPYEQRPLSAHPAPPRAHPAVHGASTHPRATRARRSTASHAPLATASACCRPRPSSALRAPVEPEGSGDRAPRAGSARAPAGGRGRIPSSTTCLAAPAPSARCAPCSRRSAERACGRAPCGWRARPLWQRS